MEFLNSGIPLGRYFGINVRLHITFLIYAYWRAQGSGNILFGLAVIVGLYFCILLHEFGHALAARWCDGEANDILLWPLGGLAFVRPAFNPTAHLITTVAGPFVTLVLWLAFASVYSLLELADMRGVQIPSLVIVFVHEMRGLNLWLLIFNLIPAFPMDGGRILRDTLWHWLSAEKATAIAVVISQILAVVAAVFAIYIQDFMLLILPVFIFMQGLREKQIVAIEARGTYDFSIRERIRRGRRQRAFRQAVAQHHAEVKSSAFHRCAVCGRTEDDPAHLDFRVCPDCAQGQEYCQEHLEKHQHQ